MKHLLTIAGSDCSGGAGVQADLKTFSALGTYGMSVICALTAQNTRGVASYEAVSPAMVSAQLEALFSDVRVDAVKVGMLGGAPVIRAVAEALRRHAPPFVVLDPVMVSKSGHCLLERDAFRALVDELLPLATIITPNLPEARELCNELGRDSSPDTGASDAGGESGPARLAALILQGGARAVLVKGGHAEGPSSDDFLLDGEGAAVFPGIRLDAAHTHGTGCSLSSALAVFLAQGCTLRESASRAKAWVANGIREGLAVGAGCGPIHHFHEFYDSDGRRR